MKTRTFYQFYLCPLLIIFMVSILICHYTLAIPFIFTLTISLVITIVSGIPIYYLFKKLEGSSGGNNADEYVETKVIICPVCKIKVEQGVQTCPQCGKKI